MKILFDTNVIIDALCERNNNYKISQELLLSASKKEIDGYISAKQITDIYYILRKYYSEKDRRRLIKIISDTFNVLPLLPCNITYCINSNLSDYEDALIEEQAKVNMMSFIVTNNTKDFEGSNVCVLNPTDLYTIIKANEQEF